MFRQLNLSTCRPYSLPFSWLCHTSLYNLQSLRIFSGRNGCKQCGNVIKSPSAVLIGSAIEVVIMELTRNFWKLRPFRPLKMSAAQGFARVRISQFHIVLACFSCILPEQGLHLRYTESCPRGRRCDTRNRGRYSVASCPESLDFMGFFGYS